MLAGLLTRGGAPRRAIDRAEGDLGVALPLELATFLEQADAAEGFVGGAYLAMWPVESIADLNRKARIPEFAPDLVFFATDGGGEGFAFTRSGGEFVNVPMIGMRIIETISVGRTFKEFLAGIAQRDQLTGPPPVVDRSRLGMIVHDVTPIIVGGNPTDPANKVLLPVAEYAEIVGWWNERLPPAGLHYTADRSI